MVQFVYSTWDPKDVSHLRTSMVFVYYVVLIFIGWPFRNHITNSIIFNPGCCSIARILRAPRPPYTRSPGICLCLSCPAETSAGMNQEYNPLTIQSCTKYYQGLYMRAGFQTSLNISLLVCDPIKSHSLVRFTPIKSQWFFIPPMSFRCLNKSQPETQQEPGAEWAEHFDPQEEEEEEVWGLLVLPGLSWLGKFKSSKHWERVSVKIWV